MGSVNVTNLLGGVESSNVSDTISNKETSTKSSRKSSGDDKGFGQVLNKANAQNVSSEKPNQTKPSKTKEQTLKSKEVYEGTVNLKQNQSVIRNKKDIATQKEEVVGEEINEAILALLSQELQIPVEELQMQLEGMSIEPTELLNEEQFGQFMTMINGEQSIEDLLTQNPMIKNVSKLFAQLEEVSAQFAGDDLEQLKMQLQDIMSNVTDVDTLEAQLTDEMSELSEEAVSSIWTAQEEEVDTQLETPVLEPFTGTIDIHGMGTTLPIESFKSAMNLGNHEAKASHFHTGTDVVQKPHLLNLGTQIVDHIEVTKLEQMQEIKMQLTPKELGLLTIKLTEKNGTFVAEIKVESEKTRDFVLSEVDSLKESLTEKGINVEEVQVDVRQNDSATQMNQQRQKSSKRIQEIIQKHLDEIEAEEAEVVETANPIIGENEIDYVV